MAQSPVNCDLCGSSENVSYYCVNCCETLCDKCRIAHANGKKTKNDNIVSLHEAHQGSFTKSPLILCDSHSSEEATLFCEHCLKVICPECLTGNHRGHRVTTAKEFKTLKSGELNNIVKVLDDKKTLYTNVFDTETHNHQQYLASVAQCKEDIASQKAKVVENFAKEVEKVCKENLNELLILQNKEEKRYSETCKRILTAKQTVTAMKQTVRNAIEASNPAAMIRASTETTLALFGFKDPVPTQLTYPNFNPVDSKYQNINIGTLNPKATTTRLTMNELLKPVQPKRNHDTTYSFVNARTNASWLEQMRQSYHVQADSPNEANLNNQYNQYTGRTGNTFW